MNSKIRCWSVVLLVSFLQFGCASWLYSEPEEVLSDSQRESLTSRSSWHLEGRVAVNSPDDAWHAGLDWQKEPGSDYLLFSGPLGQGAMRLTVEQGQATLVGDDGEVRIIPDLKTFLSTSLKFEVPLDALGYWVLGASQPGFASQMSFDAQGRLTGLDQHGWHVEYSSYMSVGDLLLPRKLSVAKPDFKLKLVVDQWGLGE